MINRMKIVSIIIFILIFFSMFSGVYADDPLTTNQTIGIVLGTIGGVIFLTGLYKAIQSCNNRGNNRISDIPLIYLPNPPRGGGMHIMTPLAEGTPLTSQSDGSHVTSPSEGVPVASLADALHVISPTEESHVASHADAVSVTTQAEGALVPSLTEGAYVTSPIEEPHADSPIEGAHVTSPTEEPHVDYTIDGAHVTSHAEVAPVASHADGASVTSSTEWPRDILPSEGASAASPTDGVPLASLADALHATSPTQESHVASHADGGHVISPTEEARVISSAETTHSTPLRTKADGILPKFKTKETISIPKQLETIEEKSKPSKSRIDSAKRQPKLGKIFDIKYTDTTSMKYRLSQLVPKTEIRVKVTENIPKPLVERLEIRFAGHTGPEPSLTFFNIRYKGMELKL